MEEQSSRIWCAGFGSRGEVPKYNASAMQVTWRLLAKSPSCCSQAIKAVTLLRKVARRRGALWVVERMGSEGRDGWMEGWMIFG